MARPATAAAVQPVDGAKRLLFAGAGRLGVGAADAKTEAPGRAAAAAAAAAGTSASFLSSAQSRRPAAGSRLGGRRDRHCAAGAANGWQRGRHHRQPDSRGGMLPLPPDVPHALQCRVTDNGITLFVSAES